MRLVMIGEERFVKPISEELGILGITEYDTKRTLEETLTANAVELSSLTNVVLFSYGRILKADELNKHYDIHNIHPSPLPLYRGADPIGSQILDGVDWSVVTLQEVALEVDTGRILATAPYDIDRRFTSYTLVKSATKLMKRYYFDDPMPMTHKVTHHDAIYREGMDMIDVGRWLRYLKYHGKNPVFYHEEEEVICKVRGAARTNYSDHRGLQVISNNTLTVFTKDYAFFVYTVQFKGKKEISSEDYINQKKGQDMQSLKKLIDKKTLTWGDVDSLSRTEGVAVSVENGMVTVVYKSVAKQYKVEG